MNRHDTTDREMTEPRSIPRALARPAALLALAAALSACGGEGEAAQEGRGGPRGGRGGAGGGRTPAVETAIAETGTIAREVSVSGVVEPIRSVGVNSQLAGALLAIYAEEGVQVREGQVLARMDDRELAAQVASAEASYTVAKNAFERAEQLRERQVITIDEYERDRTAHAAAKAQLDQLRTRRGYATVRAPVTGVVLEKRAEAGDVVGQQTRLFTIGDVSTKVVRVGVSELDVGMLAQGQPVRIAMDAVPGGMFTGRVRRIFPAADPTTRLVPVEVALEGEGASRARPGFLARVSFQTGAGQQGLLVPASAVVGAAGDEAVFVVESGKAERRTVETGLTSAGRVQIVSGLQPGEVIVVTGNNMLRDGAEVRVVSGPDAGPAPATAAEPAGARGNRGGGR